VTANGCGVSFENDDNVLKFMVVMIVQVYEYTNCILIVYFFLAALEFELRVSHLLDRRSYA
jgi:hypothetical protein